MLSVQRFEFSLDTYRGIIYLFRDDEFSLNIYNDNDKILLCSKSIEWYYLFRDDELSLDTYRGSICSEMMSSR